MRKTIWLAGVALMALSGSAFAAPQQGDLDATSTGISNLEVVIDKAVRITGINDISETVAATDVATDLVVSDDVCVYSNAPPNRGYKVTATGTAGPFELTNGANPPLVYEVRFNGIIGGGGTQLTTNTLSSAFTGGAVSEDCSVGPSSNASFEMKIKKEDLQAALALTYTGTLTMVITPE